MRRVLSVRWQLQLGFGFPVALLVTLAVGSVWKLRSMGLQIERIGEGHNRRSDLAHRLSSAQIEWTEPLRALLTVSEPVDQKVQPTALLVAQRRYVAATLTRDDAAAMQTQLKAVQGLREAISPAYDTATRSALGGARTKGAQALLLLAEAAEARSRRQIRFKVDAAVITDRAGFDVARSHQRLAMLAVAGTAAAAALVALVMAAGLVRTIARAVSKAVVIGEAITQGRLDGRVEVQRQDEFGRLVAAIATLQLRLRDSALALRELSDGVLCASDEIGAGSRNLPERTEQAAAQLDAINASVQRLVQLDTATKQNSVLPEEVAAADMSRQGRAQERRAAMGGFQLGNAEEVAIPISC